MDRNYLEKLVEIKEIYQEVDGYYVFAPNGVYIYSANDLRAIADYLDELNKDWDEQVKADLERLNNANQARE